MATNLRNGKRFKGAPKTPSYTYQNGQQYICYILGQSDPEDRKEIFELGQKSF